MNTSGNFSIIQLDTAVIRMDQEMFPRPWTDEQWSSLNPEHHRIYAWYDAGVLLAFALFGIVPNDDTAHLLKIIVAPDKRGSRLILNLWTEILTDLKAHKLKTIYLEVEAGNHRAVSFYSKCGFLLIRKNISYYSNGEDAWVMLLTL